VNNNSTGAYLLHNFSYDTYLCTKEKMLIGASSSPNRYVHKEKFRYINVWYFYSIFLFLHLLKSGKCSESIETVKENSLKKLKAIPSSAYKKCFEWIKQMCVAKNGDYRKILEENKTNPIKYQFYLILFNNSEYFLSKIYLL